VNALAPTDFTFVQTLVRQQSAIDLGPDKVYLVQSRLEPLARQQGYPSLADMLEEARRPGAIELGRRIVEALTTNETSFFRDVKPFEALRKIVLPDMFQRRRTQRQLRIWSAACSTGQEAYSIAMLLRQDFATYLNWNIQILGTDLSREVVDRARVARYSQLEVNRGLPVRLLTLYFEQVGRGDWVCKPEIRDMVHFRVLNLIDNWPGMPQQDIIFLRNVLIYFTPETRRNILQRIRSVLSPDGYLFLGGAETTLLIDGVFVRQDVCGASCYRLPGAVGK
jgi:chemotaxis protein methyltransferase CheR